MVQLRTACVQSVTIDNRTAPHSLMDTVPFILNFPLIFGRPNANAPHKHAFVFDAVVLAQSATHVFARLV
jgi:hypothetical protein